MASVSSVVLITVLAGERACVRASVRYGCRFNYETQTVEAAAAAGMLGCESGQRTEKIIYPQMNTYRGTHLTSGARHHWSSKGRHLGGGAMGVYEPPPKIYDFNFFSVNRIFETVFLLQERYVASVSYTHLTLPTNREV